MTAIMLVMMAMVALFVLGMGGVYVFLRLIGRLFPEKEKGSEHKDEREETPQT